MYEQMKPLIQSYERMAFINAWFKSIIFTSLCVANIAYSKPLNLGNTCKGMINPTINPTQQENGLLTLVENLSLPSMCKHDRYS
jgi:hypothetical protein